MIWRGMDGTERGRCDFLAGQNAAKVTRRGGKVTVTAK